MNKKLIIFGLGDMAELAAYLFGLHTDYEVVGFCVDEAYLKEQYFVGLPVVAFENIQTIYPPATHDMFVAIGYSQLNQLRAEKYHAARQKGYTLATYVSPKATVFDNVALGDNCFVFENNVLQPFVQIGENTIIWSGNHIGHHTVIGPHGFITSHAVISGRVRIGTHVFVGVNATLRDHITVGNKVVIGAGTILLKDAIDDAVYMAESTPPSSVPSHRLRGI
jgi:sugar O-acyltransferase (sialic acid O-acetyltransferase NeuD family)